MKRILTTTFYIALFIVSGIVFQISCSNTDDSSIAAPAQNNKIIYFKPGTGFLYTCNYDGTQQTQIPFIFPAGINPNPNIISPQLSPDGTKFFFASYSEGNDSVNIYSCNIDGTGFQEIVTNEQIGGQIALGNAN